MVNSGPTGTMNSMVDINNCITANIIYIELGGVRFMIDLAILRLFPESILITMFPTGIPLVNIKQQYKSLARLQQFFLKLIKLNVQSLDNYPFTIEDFTDENEVFINPNLSPMEEVYLLYINFEPNLFEYLYKYFSIKFTKMQYLKFREQYEEGEANNVDMEDIQQIKNLFYITVSQQIILVLREEIEFFVIPSVNINSSENSVEQTNSIVQLYNKDLCNLEFMHQLKNICSQFLVDRKNILVKLDHINEFEDITKAHIYLEELSKQNQEEKSSVVSRFIGNSSKKQKRNYPILNTLNILTNIQGNSTWGYRARETNKTKINSIVMLLVNLPFNTINQNCEYGLEDVEEENESQYEQQIPQKRIPPSSNQQPQQQQPQPQPQPQQPQQQQLQPEPQPQIPSSETYNNKNNNTNDTIRSVTDTNQTQHNTETSQEIINQSIPKKNEKENQKIKNKKEEKEEKEDKENENENESENITDDGDAQEDYSDIVIPPRPTPPHMDRNNRSFIVFNDMGDTSFNSSDNSRILHHSNSSNNIRTNNGYNDNSELFESHTDIGDTSSNVFKSCNDMLSSNNSLQYNDSQAIIYQSCIDVDGSKLDTDSLESMENLETKLDIDNIDNIENKLEEIHMKCSDENSVILHNSIREIVRSSSKDEENLKIISYIQDEVSDIPHNESVNLNATTVSFSNTTSTSDILVSSPLAQSDNEIIPIVVPSNDKAPVSPSSTVATFDDINEGNNEHEINQQNPPNYIYYGNNDTEQSEGNITDSSYTNTDDMTNEIVVPDLSNMVTQVEPEPNYNADAMNNTLSILQPCRNFWWESIALHLELPKNKYQITDSIKLDYSDINISNISMEDIKEQEYNIDDTEASLSFIDLKLWLRRQWTVEFCAV
ncbi:hypothetical protein H8356DRAFT_1289080 [Neocallimastix lanati (nom. inval.)]|jgi:hypothetical protein|uniref:Uncharacterized protein n=1 Tax=Neocallimastix californiae TaxID=1754190 RepID=A0A1Y2B9E6_9FUNG|nr:hypothetical protein H8356DRAFT_1289080 [Neocallimastix sp. JGI-2020a]ORY31468.1 hypothetical protein LY90DRAFT_705310 [Neocallimastix californiae]|eukprot:ORY31468.1 hypothetical protein LY90DRAFT_705310 [Neocallimastix californiae]